jgi:tetratricopeptide (TPR) repeat protein
VTHFFRLSFAPEIASRKMNPQLLVRARQAAPMALVLGAVIMAVAAYLQALHYPFISDDAGYTTENHKLAGLQLTDLWRLLVEPYNCCFEFLPLRDLSFWLDIKLFGVTPESLRMHNIILYLLSLPLVYATTLSLWRYFRRADSGSAPWAAAAVTALFALHPALVESVVWISGRKYIQPNLFAMLALWLAVGARREQGFSVPHAAAALLAFVAMMLAKSSYVGVAPVIALLWLMFWRDIPAASRRYSLLLWPIAVLLLAVVLIANFIAFNNGFDRVPFYFGIEAVYRTFAVLGWLARLAVSPEGRHFFYPVFEITYFPAMVALGAAVLSVSVAGGVMLLRKRSLEGFALAAFLLLCAPYMELIPHGSPSLVSDRYLALAVWPAALLTVALAWRLKLAARAALLLVIALLWGLQTVQRSRDWHSYEALMDADVRAYPRYSMPAMYKSDIQLSQGLIREAAETAGGIAIPEVRDSMLKLVKAHQAVADAKSTGDPGTAMGSLQDFGLGLKRPPDQDRWNTSLSLIWKVNRNYLAFEWRKLAGYFPADVMVRYTAGTSLLNAGNYDGAIAYLSAATESQHLPESLRGAAFKNLGIALIGAGKAGEAEAPLRAALEQSPPDLGAYCALSAVYKQADRLDDAASAESECRSHVPGTDVAR